MVKGNTFPYDQDKARISIHTTLFNIVMEDLVISVRQGKEIKGVHIEKEEIKLSLFTANMMIIYTKNKIKSAKVAVRTNELANEFLYTANEQSKDTIFKIPFIRGSIFMKYLRINLIKYVLNLDNKNKKQTNKQKNIAERN